MGCVQLLGGDLSRSEQNVNLDRARDELFSHIHRCGVLRASADHQAEWMDDTIAYISERYPDLNEEQLGEIRTIGLRFCRPVIDRSQETVSESETETESGGEAAESEAAAA